MALIFDICSRYYHILKLDERAIQHVRKARLGIEPLSDIGTDLEHSALAVAEGCAPRGYLSCNLTCLQRAPTNTLFCSYRTCQRNANPDRTP